MLRAIRKFLIFCFFATGLAAGLFGYWAWQEMNWRTPDIKTIYVNRGESVRAIAQKLAAEKVIADALVFEAYLRTTGLAKELKAGEYEFETGLNALQVASILVEGRTKAYSITIPEGYSIQGVCAAIADKKITDKEKCLAITRDVSLLKNPAGALSLEGYLFPETYVYDSQTSPENLIHAMVDMFYKKVGTERESKAASKGLSLHQAVILASVVEKETGAASERPLIAGVFHNRLKIDMPLQSDPTTIYGVPNFNGNLTRRDLETDTPYNTYTRKGLPVGPICNPGLAAIDAVLDPAATNALYFVAKGDGTHYFSSTLDEHNRAVYQYQIKRDR